MDLITKILIFLIFIIMFSHMFIIIKNNIRRYGFNAYNLYSLSYCLFYIFVPFIHFAFPNQVNKTTLFNKLILTQSAYNIFFTSLMLYFIYILFNFIYNYYKRKKQNDILVIKRYSSNSKRVISKYIFYTANIIFVISLFSILLIIINVGGLKNYLALGAYTRGHITESDKYISNNLLPFITLSVFSLISPYLYYCLIKLKRNLYYKLFFVLSFILAIIYLIYNQGRAPLILFVF